MLFEILFFLVQKKFLEYFIQIFFLLFTICNFCLLFYLSGKPYSSQIDTYKPTHLQQPRLLNSVQHNPSLSRTPSSSLQRNPPDPRVTPNSIQKTPSDQTHRLPQEIQRFMSPIPFQKGIPIFNQNPLASSLLAAQQAAFAYPG